MKHRYLSFTLLLVFIWGTYISQTICSYKYRKRITFDPTKVVGSSDFTNFPVLINITSDGDLESVSNGGHVESTTGLDIVFTSDDGVTLLSHELETYVATTGKMAAWVKVPTLSTSLSTYIYMYYGNSAIVTSQTTSATWSGYHGVWHFENNSFGDSSPNGYTGTNNGTTNQATAQINNGRALDGSRWIEVSSSFPNLSSDFTISGWINTSLNTKSGQRIFCDDNSNSGGYGFSVGDAGVGSLRFYSRGSSTVLLDAPNNTIANNTWYHCVAVANITSGTKQIYVNGSLVATGTFTGWGTDAGNSSIGGETATGETTSRLQGSLDEIRVANTALTADWIATEYNNQSSPSTFYTIGQEPNIWDGSASIFWNNGANWSSGGVPSSNDVILASSSNQPNLNANPQINSIWIQPTVTLSMSSRTLSIANDITNCGHIVPNTGYLNMNGTLVQNQHISGSGSYTLTNLIINNTFATSPSVTLNSPFAVNNGTFTLLSGVLKTTTTNILTLNSSAVATSGSSTSYVSGPMAKIGTANFVFPVGKDGRWQRIGISSNSGAVTTFRAEYFKNTFANTISMTSPLVDVSRFEYWQLDRTSGAANVNVSLYWENASVNEIDDCPDLTIARWNGSSWVEHPATTVAGSSCSGTGAGTITTNAVVTNFSPFAFGSKSATLNPLPITLTDFNVSCYGENVLVEWSTATELNNEKFVIERSSDGLAWKNVGEVPGAGTSLLKHEYSYTVTPSINEIYYRLIQIDNENSGKSKSWVVELDCNELANTGMNIFPNPSEGTVNIEFNTYRNASGAIVIVDNLGRTVFEQELKLVEKESIFKLPVELLPGSYIVMFRSDLVLPAQKLIVR
jgi:hypothetical protein